MPRTYHDNTFYDFIDKGWFPREDVEAFEALVARRQILAYFSPTNADELLAYWKADRKAAIRKFRIAERLVGSLLQ